MSGQRLYLTFSESLECGIKLGTKQLVCMMVELMTNGFALVFMYYNVTHCPLPHHFALLGCCISHERKPAKIQTLLVTYLLGFLDKLLSPEPFPIWNIFPSPFL